MKCIELDRVSLEINPMNVMTLKFTIDGRSCDVKVASHPKEINSEQLYDTVQRQLIKTHNVVFNEEKSAELKQQLERVPSMYNPTIESEIQLAKEQVQIKWLNWEEVEQKVRRIYNVTKINK